MSAATARVEREYVEALAVDAEPGSHADLQLAVDKIDAERLASMAAAAELRDVVVDLLADVDRRARELEEERRVCEAALNAGDAQLRAAFRWWKGDWRKAFRDWESTDGERRERTPPAAPPPLPPGPYRDTNPKEAA